MSGNDSSSWSEKMSSAKQLVSGMQLSNPTFAVILAIDAALYTLYLYRDYNEKYNMTIAHYISWLCITDCVALFLPADRRMWWNPFRALASVQLIVLTVMLCIEGVDGGSVGMTAARIALASVRLFSAVVSVKIYGPSVENIKALPSYMTCLYTEMDDWVSKAGFLHLALAFLALLTANILYMLHYNYGKSEVDGALISWQASQCLHGYTKVFVLDALTGSHLRRGLAGLLMCSLFVIQWPCMLDMFIKAPIPYAHVVAELAILTTAVAALVTNRRSQLSDVGAAKLAAEV